MEILRLFLYAACLFSLGVYAYRAYRRWLAPKPKGELPDLDEGTGASTTTSTRSTTSGALPMPSALSRPEPNPGESLVQAVIREELAKKAGAEPAAATPGADSPAPGRTGLFAGSGGSGAARVSVEAALAGVRLPDDLVPLVDGTQVDRHRVTFVSSSTPAAEIGGHLGDELERLGYQVRSESDVVAVATKGDVTLRVALFPDASNERADGAPRFPTVTRNSVVVEFST